MPVGINLGQVCVELAPTVEEVSAREEDMSLGNTPDTGRADHHPFQIKESTGGYATTSRQIGVPVTFDDAEAFCEVEGNPYSGYT